MPRESMRAMTAPRSMCEPTVTFSSCTMPDTCDPTRTSAPTRRRTTPVASTDDATVRRSGVTTRAAAVWAELSPERSCHQ